MELFKHKHPEVISARDAVYYAVKTGKLIRQPCEVCGCDKVEAHHDDYTKKLQVRWLCKKHHEEEHHGDLQTSAKSPIKRRRFKKGA